MSKMVDFDEYLRWQREGETRSSGDRQPSVADNNKHLQRAVPAAIKALEDVVANGEYPEMIRAAVAILDRAGYKPVERLEVKDTTDPTDALDPEQLEARAARLYEAARALRRAEMPTETFDDSEDRVH